MVGLTLLVAAAVLVYAGIAQRVLDRMRLSDRAALLFLAAMALGNFLPEIPITANVSVNIGGAVVPAVLVVYLFVKAGSAKERIRAVVATLVTTGIVYGISKLMPATPLFPLPIDPMYLYAILAAATGYIAGRSRRSAFIAGVSSMILVDVISRIEVALIGGRSSVTIGGAGFFDAVVVVGILAVALAEVFGETLERIQGGPEEHESESLTRGLSRPNVVKFRKGSDDEK